MDPLSATATQSFLALGDRLLEIYKIKRDGSFYQQQEYASRLREREAAIAAELAAADAASSQWRGLDIALASMSQTDRLGRFLSSNPLRLSPEDTKQVAVEASSGGKRPLLLEAPIDIDKQASSFKGHKTLDLGVGQRWSRHPCADDVHTLTGVIERPLKHQDLDVHLIARSMSEIPAILIYGHVDSESSLWLSIYAWNIVANSPGQEPMRLAFPRIDCTDASTTSSLQEWKDDLATQVTTIIALLGQWFFLIRYGRKPTLNKLSDPGHGNEMRALLARQLVAAYEVLAFEGNSSIDLRMDQAELFADAGMHAQASVFALSMLDQLRKKAQSETDYPVLERLSALLKTTGDEASASEADSLLEARSKEAVYRILGWVN
jgi:hypothetical protein